MRKAIAQTPRLAVAARGRAASDQTHSPEGRGERSATSSVRSEARASVDQRAFTRALAVDCPTCGMRAGTPCVPASLTEPHLARLMRGAAAAPASSQRTGSRSD